MTQALKHINEHTSLPLKIVAPLVTTIAIGTWMICAKLSAVEVKMEKAWTTSDMQSWSWKLQRRNPGMDVPEPVDIRAASKTAEKTVN